jgi:hypothetical protein
LYFSPHANTHTPSSTRLHPSTRIPFRERPAVCDELE